MAAILTSNLGCWDLGVVAKAPRCLPPKDKQVLVCLFFQINVHCFPRKTLENESSCVK